MAATMKDIARRTGLGLATISSYFNGGNVREKNRIKIEEAIEELHYEVNEVARGLKDQCDQDSGGCDSRAEQCFCAESSVEWRISSEAMDMQRLSVTAEQIRSLKKKQWISLPGNVWMELSICR